MIISTRVHKINVGPIFQRAETSERSINFRYLDFGLQMGFGVVFQAGYGKAMADARYLLGLSDLDKTAETIRNCGLALSVGYAIALGK